MGLYEESNEHGRDERFDRLDALYQAYCQPGLSERKGFDGGDAPEVVLLPCEYAPAVRRRIVRAAH